MADFANYDNTNIESSLLATISSAGLISADEKKKLDSLPIYNGKVFADDKSSSFTGSDYISISRLTIKSYFGRFIHVYGIVTLAKDVAEESYFNIGEIDGINCNAYYPQWFTVNSGAGEIQGYVGVSSNFSGGTRIFMSTAANIAFSSKDSIILNFTYVVD